MLLLCCGLLVLSILTVLFGFSVAWILVFSFLFLIFLIYAAYKPGIWGYAILHGDREQKKVALTFDDGPDPNSTLLLLEALKAADVQATFFVLVDRAMKYPDLTKKIAENHEIALHGLKHNLDLVFSHPSAGSEMLLKGAFELNKLTGQEIKWFRPPFGITSPRTALALEKTPLSLVWCSLRTGDGVNTDPNSLRKICIKAGPGDIVLLHEGARAAREALPGILEDLKMRGLKPVSLRELLS